MKYRMHTFFFAVLLMGSQSLYSRILPVGVGKTFATVTAAAQQALAGDTILCYDASINGGMYIENLKGNQNQWIYLRAAQPGATRIQGGSNAIQFTDAAYLHIEGFVISGQTGNGLNMDDGGSYNTPSHHLRLVNCTFENINATGNNDLLKMSGIDSFVITGCTFRNGAAGGSGIDMVGCHFGVIEKCNFSNLGSNSIQAKGGTADLIITRNVFTNGGARALNLGGSTGLSFFRPIDAKYEAARIRVIANVISGSEAPVAYVGCTEVVVSNNTLLFPGKWVARILQETVDPTRFVPCGNNQFFNNLIVVDQRVSTEVNIGPNTAPETFSFQHNMWYKTTQPSWSGPQLPGTKVNNWVADPLIQTDSLYVLEATSPAIAKGLSYGNEIVTDISGKTFFSMPTLGAWEAKTVTTQTKMEEAESPILIYPNPCHNQVAIRKPGKAVKSIRVYDVTGKAFRVISGTEQNEQVMFDIGGLEAGSYFFVDAESGEYLGLVVKPSF